MRPSSRWRPALVVIGCALAAPACDRGRSQQPANALKQPGLVQARRDEIPLDQLGPIMAATRAGLGSMEQFAYDKAVEEFRKVHERAPGWTPGAINLALALLNDTGVREKKARERGQGASKSNYDEALALLDEVLGRDPNNLHAHYGRGIILQQQGELARAHEDFRAVTERDPTDGHAWYWLGRTLVGPDGRPAGPNQAKELIAIYSKALEANPYLDPALYNLQQAYALASLVERAPDKKRALRDEQARLLGLRNRLNPERAGPVPGPGETAEMAYGSMGRYATVIDPEPRRAAPAGKPVPPGFDAPAPLRVELPAGHRWARAEDFTGAQAILGRARARFGAAVAAVDVDGDGKLDLYLAAAVVGPKGLRDALLRNRGEGRFEDATAAFGLPEDRASLGVAAGDFDADRHVDLFLTGVGDSRLYRNIEGKRFEDVTKPAGLALPAAVSLTARWLDLDQDGDLDLYVVNYTAAEHAAAALGDTAPPGLANAVYRNDGKPAPQAGAEAAWAPAATTVSEREVTQGLSIALTPWPEAAALLGGDHPHTGLAALDIDSDRDVDLVLSADGVAPRVILNDRLGRYHAATIKGPEPRAQTAGLLVADLDKDGRPDLVALSPSGPAAAWRNATDRRLGEGPLAFEPWPIDARDWRGGMAIDLDLDGWIDLVGLPAVSQRPLDWARNEGDRLKVQGPPLPRGEATGDDRHRAEGFALADLVDSPLPEAIVVLDGAPPLLARNAGNGNRWLALSLGGHWNVKPKLMRTNPHGLGTRLSLEGDGLYVPYDHTTPESGLAQSLRPLVLGLGKSKEDLLLHLRWPDGVLQCEVDLKADGRLHTIEENNRKEGSCPVLFTYDGRRFVCVADFLGGGGLGYLVAPGVYSQPDRDEAVAIDADQLRAVDGTYRLAVAEPMSEVAYLDRLALEVVDRPPGVATVLDERFAPGGNRPTGELVPYTTAIEPLRATDLAGRDITDLLRHRDDRVVAGFRRLAGWVGYAEEHGIELDFGDRLARLGPLDRVFLCLAGGVEYPYSQTNYAAATAGVRLRPPALERRRDDGSWGVIEPDPGYPAGLPRLTALELTGKLSGPRCVLRLRTNMEIYWDQAFVAARATDAGLRVTRLELARAELGYRGALREVPPGGQPLSTYDHERTEAAPLARLSGRLTRYGDVAPLLRADDDRLCVLGPGDEVRLEFDALGVPELPAGWSRAYVLRAVGYCKDADPCTAASDTVEPLPWRGMGAYPFGPAGRRPADPAYRDYLRTYQTRAVGR